MKRNIFYITLVLCVLKLHGFSQMVINDHAYAFTIFDKILVAEKGLTCIQYYNKLKSDYYKQDNYQAYGPQKSLFLSPVYTKKTPWLTINGKSLEQYDFEEVMKFKKILDIEITPERKKAWKGEAERYGKIAFKAEK